MKRLVVTFLASFAIFLLFSVVFVQLGTSGLTETRKSAIVRALTGAQLDLGAFHFFENITSTDYFNEGGSSLVIISLGMLDGLDNVNLEAAAAYIASKQGDKSGGFGAFYGYDGTLLGYDLDFTYEAVHALMILKALPKLNTTALVDFVLTRYNRSTGSFHELSTEAYGTEYAMSHFNIRFRSWNAEMAYAIPNVISTYLGVSILADLEMLDLINGTKTFEWIISAQASNRAFKPYPSATYTYVPGWSSLISNPFDVDEQGTGVPYTFAAVEALKHLGHLEDLTSADRDQIAQYLVSCQGVDGNFSIHPSYNDKQLSYTYYAVTALDDITRLQETEDSISKVTEHVMNNAQLLDLDNSWPVPQSAFRNLSLLRLASDVYGLFHETSTDPIEDTFYAVSILNATGNLALLDQSTPKALQTRLNLVLLSIGVASVTTALFILITIRKQRLAKTNLEKRTGANGKAGV